MAIKPKNNYKPTAPPPNVQDLLFQAYQFDERVSGKMKPVQLSSRFFNSYLGDKTLTWQLGDKIKRAGKVLADTK